MWLISTTTEGKGGDGRERPGARKSTGVGDECDSDTEGTVAL